MMMMPSCVSKPSISTSKALSVCSRSSLKCPAFAAIPTVVGSFPHTEPSRLLDRIFSLFPDMPAWPQMPVRDWRESMYVQYAEGLPGAVVDGAAQTIYFRGDEALAGELEAFYQALVDEDVERFAISRSTRWDCTSSWRASRAWAGSGRNGSKGRSPDPSASP